MYFQPADKFVTEAQRRHYEMFTPAFPYDLIGQTYLMNDRIARAVHGAYGAYNGVYVDSGIEDTVSYQLATGGVTDVVDNGLYWSYQQGISNDYTASSLGKFYDDYFYFNYYDISTDNYYFSRIGPLSGTPTRTDIFTDTTTSSGPVELTIDYFNGMIYHFYQWEANSSPTKSEWALYSYNPSTGTNSLITDSSSVTVFGILDGIAYEDTGTYVYVGGYGTEYLRIEVSTGNVSTFTAPDAIVRLFGKGFIDLTNELYNIIDDQSWDLGSNLDDDEIIIDYGASIIGDAPPYYLIPPAITRLGNDNYSFLYRLNADGTVDKLDDGNYQLMYTVLDEFSHSTPPSGQPEKYLYYPSNPLQYNLVPGNHRKVNLFATEVH